ncbi:hypothetical protein RRF57_005853 [Xylaria bambusicola]|uniref:Uncharacterized protein n=1 Tax=Xylaria bambusicola TaxID=326684 RepID=A0AAN7UPF4_9PEZI
MSLFLSVALYTVKCLEFGSLVPPWVHYDHSIGLGNVQANIASFHPHNLFGRLAWALSQAAKYETLAHHNFDIGFGLETFKVLCPMPHTNTSIVVNEVYVTFVEQASYNLSRDIPFCGNHNLVSWGCFQPVLGYLDGDHCLGACGDLTLLIAFVEPTTA